MDRGKKEGWYRYSLTVGPPEPLIGSASHGLGSDVNDVYRSWGI